MQLAANGAWEQAWVLRPDERTPRMEEVRRWLDRYDDSVAFEVFFAHPGGAVFLGVRLTDLESEERTRLVEAVIESVFRAAWSDLSETLAGLEDIASQPVGSLLSGDPAWLELGVVNAWRSVGSQVLWRLGDPPPNGDTFRQKLGTRRQLLAPQTNPLALEFAFSDPLPHWLGVPVSRPGPKGHVLDLSALSALARAVLKCVGKR